MVPFFAGEHAALSNETTFVKLDCEGAELELLETVGADWQNVSALEESSE